MGAIKGQKEYKMFQKGAKLTRKQAMLANCFMCNGLEESREDCQGKSCPIYPFRPYKRKFQAEKAHFIETPIKERVTGESNDNLEMVNQQETTQKAQLDYNEDMRYLNQEEKESE